MNTSFLTQNQLETIGFRHLGRNVLISKNTSIYRPELISIENNVRIDDFCIISGEINLGSHIHIAAGVYLFGGNTGIHIQDFAGLSSRCSIYAESDDYSGKYLTNPTVDEAYRKISKKRIQINKHAILGASSIILPGASLAEGTALGANSLLTKVTQPWSVYFGSPAKRIRARSNELLKLEKGFLEKWKAE